MALLRAAWSQKTRSWPRVLSGWGLVFASLWGWRLTSGADKGVALGVVAGLLIALAFLAAAAINAPKRPGRPTRLRNHKQPPQLHPTAARLLPRRLWCALLIGPLAGLAALAISTAAFAALDGAGVQHTANITTVSFGFPMCWAGLAVAVGYQFNLWHKTLTVAAAALVPFGYLWIVA